MATSKHYMWWLAGAEDISWFWHMPQKFWMPECHIRYEGAKRITTSGCDYQYRYLDTKHLTEGIAAYAR